MTSPTSVLRAANNVAVPFACSHRAAPTGLEGQARLRPVEGLDLTLLVDIQDECAFGRVKIQLPTIASTFSAKAGPRLILEGLCEVRLQPAPTPVRRILLSLGPVEIGRAHV